jgi:NAD(P)-dependent dehydrogenase (short-subunit alcohol dehydrogenase family)
MTELSGKRAIITGAANGIGRATAELFVQEGARVVIADVADEPGRELARQLGPAAVYCHADVSSAADVEALVRFAVESLGGLDILFNNAGITESVSKVDLVDETFERFTQVMAVDLLGPMLGTRYAARVMQSQRQGVILNTASTGGFYAGYGMPMYRAAKAGVIAFTQMSAIELGQHGIRVNCISPGPVETNLPGAAFPPEIATRIGKATSRLLTEMQILERTGKPRDIANAAVFLASDRAAQITGHNLVVDGGLSVGDKTDRMARMQTEIQAILGAGNG